jgi:hypothetical protein
MGDLSHPTSSPSGNTARPNGKLCIVAPLMPIPQAIIKQDTRHLKNIAFDIEHKILAETSLLQRYGLFVWRK